MLLLRVLNSIHAESMGTVVEHCVRIEYQDGKVEFRFQERGPMRGGWATLVVKSVMKFNPETKRYETKEDDRIGLMIKARPYIKTYFSGIQLFYIPKNTAKKFFYIEESLKLDLSEPGDDVVANEPSFTPEELARK